MITTTPLPLALAVPLLASPVSLTFQRSRVNAPGCPGRDCNPGYLSSLLICLRPRSYYEFIRPTSGVQFSPSVALVVPNGLRLVGHSSVVPVTPVGDMINNKWILLLCACSSREISCCILVQKLMCCCRTIIATIWMQSEKVSCSN